mmetsp:Transcript_63667/g.76522  ORF Transcript_63667/g.76522 Transcript_63667/m.76522 type:complete len:88 (+) Transcript_63667:79-342(+)
MDFKTKTVPRGPTPLPLLSHSMGGIYNNISEQNQPTLLKKLNYARDFFQKMSRVAKLTQVLKVGEGSCGDFSNGFCSLSKVKTNGRE